MDGLAQSYMFKERLLKCEPIDLSHFIVNLREALGISGPFSDAHPRERNKQQMLDFINGAPSLQRGPWQRICHTPFPNTCLLTLCITLFTAWHASDLMDTLECTCETVAWNYNTSPTCDLCNSDDIQDEQHVLFHCTHPHAVSLRRTCATVFPPTGSDDVYFSCQNNSIFPSWSYFFL